MELRVERILYIKFDNSLLPMYEYSNFRSTRIYYQICYGRQRAERVNLTWQKAFFCNLCVIHTGMILPHQLSPERCRAEDKAEARLRSPPQSKIRIATTRQPSSLGSHPRSTRSWKSHSVSWYSSFSYLVETPSGTVRRNQSHLARRPEEDSTDTTPETEQRRTSAARPQTGAHIGPPSRLTYWKKRAVAYW